MADVDQGLGKKERRRLRALNLARGKSHERFPESGSKARSMRIGFVAGAMWYRAFKSGARDEAEVDHG